MSLKESLAMVILHRHRHLGTRNPRKKISDQRAIISLLRSSLMKFLMFFFSELEISKRGCQRGNMNNIIYLGRKGNSSLHQMLFFKLHFYDG
mmetsp:Transcript_703/g.1680  ORF Transcript_703/g.1680 Transcript_703/m.1680 type:complete len:92 (+) Transcript_703:372-647(+)